MERFETDAVVIGAGVVGLAVGAALAAAGRETLIIEKNPRFGEETSSRNSEVIHAGLYYPEGSLKAALCVEGRERLYAFAGEAGVAHRALGKLIVATEQAEVATLETIAARAEAAGAGRLEMLSAAAARAMEPDLSCVAALWSPRTGVIDSHGLMLALLGRLEGHGGALALSTPVARIALEDDGRVALETGGDAPARITAGLVVNAAGLWAPAIARRFGPAAEIDALRFSLAKGNYFALSGVRAPFSRLIYPAPVKGGLGVHLTLDLAGGAKFGPDVELLDHDDPTQIEYAVDPTRAERFYGAVRKYWPALPDGALRPDYSGVRPKAEDATGLVDFRILQPPEHGGRVIHLLGFESPALTACLAIAARVVATID